MKLEKEYGDRLKFARRQQKGQFSSYIMFSANIDISTAVLCAYDLGTKNMIEEVGGFLRETILDAFKNSESMPWPPAADFLESLEDATPNHLKTFMSILISGKKDPDCQRTNRIIVSICQDICRAATAGKWKLPKHIFICMTIRHLFRSKELCSLLHRMGHSESYNFSLDLEVALAAALRESSELLSNQIIRNPVEPSLFHSDFDNFDQLVNNLTGSGSIHTAHGIMLQEVSPDENIERNIPIPEVPRDNQPLHVQQSESLPDCYVSKRDDPKYDIRQHTLPGSKEASEKSLKVIILWLMNRYLSQREQEVPSWGGFISTTSDTPLSLTTVDYYPPINHPITDYKTVQECLRYAEEATQEVGQLYTVTTFDLGVCMKAYPLTWKYPVKYQNHIVMIGTFHIIYAYFKMIGHKMNGSGLSDILTEAGLISSGSINGVLSGKHYSRAMHCHRILLEALERKLFDRFVARKGEVDLLSLLQEDSIRLLEELRESPSKVLLETVMSNGDIALCIGEYVSFLQDIRIGELGKTAQFWMSYMDHIRLVLSLIKAVKQNDFVTYTYCLFAMPDLFFSFGGQNYARYLTFFSVFLANIELTHPGSSELLKRGAISVARSFIPGNRCAVDKTIEETIMKHAKSRGGAGGAGVGLSGILTNYDAYQRWAKTAHERAKYVSATLNMADMLAEGEGSKHKDVRPAEIQNSEKCVQRVIAAIDSFSDPFDNEEKDALYSLSSGAQASSSIEKDVLQAEAVGNEAKLKFIAERLEKKEKFFDPIKKFNLKTMGHMNKTVCVKTTQNKVIVYRQQSNVAFQLLFLSQNTRLDLKEILKYPLTPIPFSLGTADGFLTKTDKASGYHYLTTDAEDAPLPPTKTTLLIADGNAMFYMKDVPSNFKQISCKLFDSLPKAYDVLFSTDSYQDNSIKEHERLRRGCGEKLIIKGELTKRPSEWKVFLSSSANKKQFISIISNVWSSNILADKLTDRKLFMIEDGYAHCISSDDGNVTECTDIPELASTQEETDTRVVLYCIFAKDKGYRYARVKTPDTDIFFILLNFALTIDGLIILFDTGKKLLNITQLAEMYTQQYCSALLGLHAFTKCDTTSAFKGKGKVKPIKLMQRIPKFQAMFASLGDLWDIPDDLMNGLEEFTCAMYGKPHMKSVDELRLQLLQAKCGNDDGTVDPNRNIDLANLPPCKLCLIQHINRSNYQVGVWKHAHIAKPEIPSPLAGHGWTMVDGHIEPLWIEGDIMPQELADMLEAAVGDVAQQDDEETTFDVAIEDQGIESEDSEDDD